MLGQSRSSPVCAADSAAIGGASDGRIYTACAARPYADEQRFIGEPKLELDESPDATTRRKR